MKRDELMEKYVAIGENMFHKDWEKLNFILNMIKKTSPEISKDLIKHMGTVENVIKASNEKLLSFGINEYQAATLKFLATMQKHLFMDHTVSNRINISSKNELIAYIRNNLAPFCKNEIGHDYKENFYVMYLNSANQLINDNELKSGVKFTGTIDRSAVYPREIYIDIHNYNEKIEKEKMYELGNHKQIVSEAIKLNCKSVILIHNHPSGNYKPSRSDIDMTKELQSLLGGLNIKVLDHMIVTKESYFSFLEEGLIEN